MESRYSFIIVVDLSVLLWAALIPFTARGIGHVITPYYECALRQMETGPKIASYYIANPALLYGRKFDLRYSYCSMSHDRAT